MKLRQEPRFPHAGLAHDGDADRLGIRYALIAGPDERIVVGISATASEGPILSAVLAGTREPLTDRNLSRVFLQIPAITLKVSAAIHWEALKLWAKRIRLHRRPAPPEHATTIVPATSAPLD